MWPILLCLIKELWELFIYQPMEALLGDDSSEARWLRFASPLSQAERGEGGLESDRAVGSIVRPHTLSHEEEPPADRR